MRDQTRILPITGVKNFRDMGGYKTGDGRSVAWGRLFRSGHLSELPDDIGDAITSRNITSVIDFRSDAEKKRNPVRWPQGWAPHYSPLPIGGNASAWVHEMFERLSNSDFPARELHDQFILAFQTIPIANAPGLKAFFDTLLAADHGNAVLFHCTAGKDRTGIAGALLMKALGVADDDIMADFLLTNEAVDIEKVSEDMAGRLSARAGRPIAAPDVLPLVGVREEFLQSAYDAIGEKFGSVDAYLTDSMGLDTAKRALLADRFLSE